MTQYYTEMFYQNDIEKSVRSAKKEIAEILSSLKDRTAVFTYNGQTVAALPCDFPRLIVEWSRSTNIDQSIRSVIVSALLSAEEKSSGSGLLAAGLWTINLQPSPTIRTSKRAFYNEVNLCLEYFGGTGMSRHAAQAVVDLGGLGHRVEYTETSGLTTLIDVSEGKEILGSIDPLFADRIGHELSLQNCAVVAVDGVVETVSSVHRILEESSERTIVFMANSFLPDVSSTMAATWAASRGKCVPFCVTSWECDAFLTLEKIGVKCVSQERGDLVSSLTSKDVNSTSVEIQNTHLILKSNNELDRSKITVKVSKSLGGLTGIALDRIKILVSYARNASRYGVVKWEDLQDLSQELQALYSRELVIPWSTLAGASKSCQSLTEILQNLACLITVKKGEKL